MNQSNDSLWFYTMDGFMTFYSSQFSYSKTPFVNEWIGERQFDIDASGVICYNGYDSIYFYFNDTITGHYMGANTYNDIKFDSNGNTWIATFNGVYKFDGTQFEHYTVINGLIGNIVNCIYELDDGRICFGTSAGLSIFDGSFWGNFNSSNGLVWSSGNSSTVLSVEEDSQGNLWIGGNEIAYFDWNIWTIYVPTQIFNSTQSIGNINSIQEDSSGKIWYGTKESGLITFDNGSWNYQDEMLNLDISRINQVFKTNNNELFIATCGSGLFSINNADTINYSTNDGLVENYIRDIFCSQNGDIWVGTKEGINKKTGNQWETYFNYFSSGASYVILEDNSKILTSSTGYLHRMDSMNWDTIMILSGGGWIKDIYVINEDHYLLASEGGITECIGPDFSNNLNWYSWNSTDGLPSNSCECIEVDSAGNVWIGTYNGIANIIDSNIFIVNPLSHQFGKHIMDIRTDLLGNVWFASDNGVAKYDGMNWDFFYDSDGLISNFVEDIEIASDSSIWFACYGGVSKYDEPIFTSFTEADGLINYQTHCLEQDIEGNIWVGTQHGISKLINVVDIDTSTMIVDNFLQSIQIYPNPMSTTITICGTQNGDVIKLFDLLGNCLFEKHNQVNFMDLSSFKNASYLLTVERNNIAFRKLLIKTN